MEVKQKKKRNPLSMLTLPLHRVLLAIHFRLRGRQFPFIAAFPLAHAVPPFFFPVLRGISLRVPLVYFNTSLREEIDRTRYELAAPQKSRRLGADFDNKKEKRKEKSRINDFCCTRDPDREIACKLDGVNFFRKGNSRRKQRLHVRSKLQNILIMLIHLSLASCNLI